MRKFLTLGILAIILGGIYAPSLAVAQISTTPNIPTNLPTNCPPGQIRGNSGTCETDPQASPRPTTGANLAGSVLTDITFGIFGPLIKGIGYLLMTLSAGILGLAGKIFDFVIKFSILEMADTLGNPEGIGGSISLAWATLRDIANMCFIFVLLFTAFKAMFELNFGSVGGAVKNIIIVALLINFSLFFSKVVIDASNIVAIGFYNSIVNTNTASQTGGEGSTTGNSPKTITTGYMNMLGLSSLYDPEIALSRPTDASKMLITGIMSSIFMLITAVIFLITSVMLLARFILLVFIMILSPLALIAIIIPGQMGQFNKWKDALISQSFFAPLFFALTWVVFKLGAGLKISTSLLGANSATFAEALGKAPTDDSMKLLLNYFLIIGFSIAALIFSKQMATKTAGFSTISGGLGTIGAGGAAWLGRSSIGLAGKKIAERAGLQEAASKKGFVGGAARAALYASKKARSGSFDVRNATVPTSVVSDAIKGTIGRTGMGKAMGLNDVNIPNVELGNRLGKDIWGTADTKGYKERKEESEKRLRTEAAASASELTLAKAKKDVVAGSKAPAGSPSIGDMEKALASLSDKETEALVASNRDLLESQNFANAISVKQLETLNKSDQFSDEEKGKLKSKRFEEIGAITDAAGLAALAVPAHTRTPAQAADAARVEKARSRIKSLSDSEIEMINPNYLDPALPEGREFISQLKGGQADNIINNKSGKFTATQKESVKKERLRPLLDALSAGRAVDAQNMVRKADIKTKVGYMKVDGRGIPPVKIALDTDIIPMYVPKILQRMAAHDDMSDDDIHTLRMAILATLPPTHPTVIWLMDPNKGLVDFP